MRIHTSDRPTGEQDTEPDRGRRWHRSLGAMVALFSLVGVGALVGPVGQASAAGPTWAGTGAALPANAGPGHVSALSATNCPAPGNCVAVGDYRTAASGQQGLVEIQHGGSWTAAELPLPANAESSPDVQVLNLSCPTVGIVRGRRRL